MEQKNFQLLMILQNYNQIIKQFYFLLNIKNNLILKINFQEDFKNKINL